MIIMTDSHKVVPGPTEERIKREVPFLSNVMIIGDKLNYLTCLITLKVQLLQKQYVETCKVCMDMNCSLAEA